jgi:hypothetical protein
MEPFIYVAAGLIIAGIILFISFYYRRKAIVKRKLGKAPLKKISDFQSGETARFNGKVELIDEPLIAPLSKRECAYYYIHVEERVSSGKESHWRTLIEEEESCRFVIRDWTKCAFIQDKNIKSYIVQDREYKSGFLNDATPELEQYLNQHCFKSEGMLGMNKTIRYREGVLEKGEEITVMGRGEWMNASQVGLPENLNRVLIIRSSEQEKIYLSDDPEMVQS